MNLTAKTSPHRTGKIKYWIGYSVLRLFGWQALGQAPSAAKCILIGAPHTSNWDFPLAIAASYVYRIEIHWLGKSSLFRFPCGWLMRRLGGIPVDRSHSQGMVEQLKNTFDVSEHLILAIAAKGTRKKTQYWKSGFYWLAYTAKVPVQCCYLNYRNRQLYMGLSILPCGDVKKDMDVIREFFRGMHGKNPQLEDTIRLKEEDL